MEKEVKCEEKSLLLNSIRVVLPFQEEKNEEIRRK